MFVDTVLDLAPVVLLGSLTMAITVLHFYTLQAVQESIAKLRCELTEQDAEMLLLRKRIRNLERESNSQKAV